MARSTRPAADEPDIPAEPGVEVVPEAPADVPVPIDVAGLDVEAHVASVVGGYTVSTAPAED